MAELILPTVRLHAAFLECRDDWGSGLPHEDGFGLSAEDDVDSPEGFAAWVHRARRRGPAGWALGQMLAEARAALGLDRVLVPCLADNAASARTIEANGGVLEGIRDTPAGRIRRYWIPVPR